MLTGTIRAVRCANSMLCALSALALTAPSHASAVHKVKESEQVWTVDDDGPADFSSIQSAIVAASDGDTIAVEPGHYGRIDFLAKRLSVVSTSGPLLTVIDGQSVPGMSAVLIVDASGPALLDGFTVRGGTGTTGDFGGDQMPQLTWHGGAGIAVVRSHLVVVRCVVTDNHGAVFGGGVGCILGSMTIRDSTVCENSADQGGAINGWAADIRCERVQILDNWSVGLGAGAIDMWCMSISIVDRLELVDVESLGNLAFYAGPMWDGVYNGGEMLVHVASVESILNAGWIGFRGDLGPSTLDVAGDLSFVHGSKWFGSGMGRISVGVHPSPAGPASDMVRVAGTLGVPHEFDESDSLGLLNVSFLEGSVVTPDIAPLEFLRFGQLDRGFTMIETRGLPSGTFLECAVGPSGTSPAQRLFGSIRSIASGNGSLLDSQTLPAEVTTLSIVDWDNDGHLDVCVGMAAPVSGKEGQVVGIRNSGNGPDGAWLGLGGGSFTIGLAGVPVALAAGDFGGDPNADLLVAFEAGQLVTLASDWSTEGLPWFARSSLALEPLGIDSVAHSGLFGLSRSASGNPRIVVQDATSGTVSIAEFAPIPSDMQCACNGRFGAGSRVRSAVANPGGTGLPMGAQGTTVFAVGEPVGMVVVRWDEWSGGQDYSSWCGFYPCCGAFQSSGGQFLSLVPCEHLKVPAFSPVGQIERQCQASCVAATNDGNICAAGCIDSGTLRVRIAPASGLPAEMVDVDFLHGQSAVALADLDGDGMEDVLAALPGIDTVAIALRRPGASVGLLPWFPISVGHSPSQLAAGDIDGDGDIDFAVLVEMPDGGAAIELFRNTSFSDYSFITFDMIGHADVGPGVPREFRLADLTGDGRLDVVAVVSPTASGFSQAPTTVRVFGVVVPQRPCDSDLNLDSAVNGEDLAVLLATWGGEGSEMRGDINRDGSVDGKDLALLLASWGACP